MTFRRGSVVLHRQSTFWELYWRYIIGGIVLLLLQTLLIFATGAAAGEAQNDRK